MDKSSPEYKEALHEHARTLGLDPIQEAQYLWIVEEALTAPLPDDWEQGETDDGTIYYFNVNSEESIWEHPMDGHYKEMIAKKKEEDAKKLAFNSAPKKDLGRRQTSVHEFDMVDTIEDITSNKPAPVTSAGSAFGKDSKAWLLDDEDDFDVPSPTPMPKSFSIVSSIKKTEEHTVVSKAVPTPTPLLSTPMAPTVTTTATTAIKTMGSTVPTSTNKEAEKQIETLRAEIAQLKKSHETAEKQAKTTRDKLNQENETLRRGKEAAETEAKEANYLRMKINELKTKVAALEAQTTKGDPDASRALDGLRADVDAKTKEIAEAQAQLETAKDEHSRAIQKREDSLAALKKEHAIEVEALQEQLLLRQATNITLQHSTGELEKLKKRISELEDDALKTAKDHAKVVEDLNAVHAETIAALALAQKKCSEADAAQASQRDQLDAQTSQLEAKLKLQAKATDDMSQQLQDVERQLQDTKDKWRTATAHGDELALHVRRLEDKERSATMAFADEKRLLEQSVKSWQDRLQAVQRDLETLGVAAKAEKEAHAHALSVANDALNEMRREKERALGQFGEVQALKKDNESLNLDLGRVRDQKANLEFELRNLKQAQSVDTSQLMQYKVQIEEYARKEFMEKQRFEMLAGEKVSIEKKIGAMDAQIQTLRAEHRTDLDKYLYRIRELESQNARLEYDISRAEEKFSTAEKWRLKEVSRVEQRDTELLEIKEELGRAKARNIEGENHHLINELRGQTKLLEQKIIELERALANEVSVKTQAERLWAAEADNAKKQWTAQIPQLAAAATQRASDEWKKRCDDMVEKIKAEYQDSWLQERQQTTTREAHWHEAKRDLERQIQTFASEKDFLTKEISRLEDNNKHLMEQLHTIRVYLTQRPLHGTFPPPPQVVSPAPTNVATDPQLSSHLQHQLGVLHAQFQQLFEASTTPPPAPRSSYVSDYKPAPETPLPETAPSGAHLLEEKQRLIRSMEDVGLQRSSSEWIPVIDTADQRSLWYRQGYWRSKYT
ncbi:hypothetical protein SDRG_13644 [Saprolegnia diclina VS20]|uniref:WW domain-containing protein n=1 Tax=Saprolegnia diclina (strain VS20) TaxID=1156394 RepID=T0Q1Z9_SAPDV|nr:hypothetical protein SDRG_13644 [Saprolegnia diclina VS20]EQC28566.1 hypothetical protein SDRG_13644 [Saprolegnia diclina VS20]|eukprot:XP_008617963.1 hypothetical protein SDRG_13644 [Saprolegnia diclina VS20]